MTLNNMSLGQPPSPARIALLTEALALHETLLASEKGPVFFHHRNIARTRFNLGNAYKALGRLDEASPLAKAARDGLRQVVLDAPGNVTFQGDLAAACLDLADLLARQGRMNEAVDAGEEGIAIFEELARVDSENSTYRGFFASIRGIVAEAHESLGHTEESLRHRRGRLALLERISASRPNDPQTRADIAAEHLVIERLLGEAVPIKPRSGSSR
jgi:tetratricopeptide (TPR) repeat protein